MHMHCCTDRFKDVQVGSRWFSTLYILSPNFHTWGYIALRPTAGVRHPANSVGQMQPQKPWSRLKGKGKSVGSKSRLWRLGQASVESDRSYRQLSSPCWAWLLLRPRASLPPRSWPVFWCGRCSCPPLRRTWAGGRHPNPPGAAAASGP